MTLPPDINVPKLLRHIHARRRTITKHIAILLAAAIAVFVFGLILGAVLEQAAPVDPYPATPSPWTDRQLPTLTPID